MATNISVNRVRFATWLRMLDKKVGINLPPQDYLEEADFYLKQPKVAWPCDILALMGNEHADYHGKSCKSSTV